MFTSLVSHSIESGGYWLDWIFAPPDRTNIARMSKVEERKGNVSPSRASMASGSKASFRATSPNRIRSESSQHSKISSDDMLTQYHSLEKFKKKVKKAESQDPKSTDSRRSTSPGREALRKSITQNSGIKSSQKSLVSKYDIFSTAVPPKPVPCSSGCVGNDYLATHHCENCVKDLCRFCVLEHSQNESSASHVLIPLAEYRLTHLKKAGWNTRGIQGLGIAEDDETIDNLSKVFGKSHSQPASALLLPRIGARGFQTTKSPDDSFFQFNRVSSFDSSSTRDNLRTSPKNSGAFFNRALSSYQAEPEKLSSDTILDNLPEDSEVLNLEENGGSQDQEFVNFFDTLAPPSVPKLRARSPDLRGSNRAMFTSSFHVEKLKQADEQTGHFAGNRALRRSSPERLRDYSNHESKSPLESPVGASTRATTFRMISTMTGYGFKGFLELKQELSPRSSPEKVFCEVTEKHFVISRAADIERPVFKLHLLELFCKIPPDLPETLLLITVEAENVNETGCQRSLPGGKAFIVSKDRSEAKAWYSQINDNLKVLETLPEKEQYDLEDLESDAKLTVGSKVRLQGFKPTGSFAQYNGVEGFIDDIDPTTDRFFVEVEGKIIKAKEENLRGIRELLTPFKRREMQKKAAAVLDEIIQRNKKDEKSLAQNRKKLSSAK
eukprot:766515-Hanusia_phi.AAC.2